MTNWWRMCRSSYSVTGRAGPSRRLAASSGVSARTLTRRFKSATGVSISEYLQRRRLDEAQALLRPNLSVTEVASSVGLS